MRVAQRGRLGDRESCGGSLVRGSGADEHVLARTPAEEIDVLLHLGRYEVPERRDDIELLVAECSSDRFRVAHVGVNPTYLRGKWLTAAAVAGAAVEHADGVALGHRFVDAGRADHAGTTYVEHT